MKTLFTLLILLIPFIGISQTVYVTNTNDSGPGSLRDAVINASDGTTIRFDESINNQTITLSSSLTSNANIRIVGNADDQTSSLIKFDNSFFSYGELIIDSIDIHPNSLQDFVFFHIYNDFQFINSYAYNIESSAKIFSIQSENSDININIQNSNFINIPGKLFYLHSPNINFDLSFCYGNNINTFIDDFILNGSSDISISYSEFNNSKIITNTAIEKLEIFNSTFNNFDISNSNGLNMSYYYLGENINLNIDSSSFYNSNLNFNPSLGYEIFTDLQIANSNFNNCFLEFRGQGNLENVDINNFESLALELISINNSTISSNGSQNNFMTFSLDSYDANYSLDFNKNIFDCDILLNGNELVDNYTFIESSLNGNLSTNDIDNLSLVSCILKDNDNLSLVIDNEQCQNCNTFIKSSFFSNNQGGFYSFNYMIYQFGGNLEIENSTFYNNDNVIYFGSGTDISVKSSTFYQNEIGLNLIQWQPEETGSVTFYNSIVGHINFTFGSSIIASGYNIFSNSLNNLPETNFDGISDLNLSLIDDNSSITPYLLADYCSIAHDNGDPNFEGSIVNTEVPVNIKDIGSAERTDICDENESTWSCNNEFACVELSDGSGNFQSLEECESNCSVIIEDSWNCVNDACVDPLDGSGEFSTLNDCEQVCQNISSINENLIDVNIFPNPSSNIFNLEFNSDSETEILVTNILGEQVYFESINTLGELYTQIDLSNEQKGVYNLTIKTSDRISNHKLILQ
ncbi:MAG: T9SS type A sorting domain-containing protein [Flavobacteriales bacterium]|nr:T9SS type A sorting domain-containing protein [Flavobacteriales bacterium]